MVFCVGLVALMGYFVSVQVTQAHRHTAATATVAYVRAVLTPHVMALGTVRGQNDELSAHLDAAFSDSLFTETGLEVSVVRRDGTVVYSNRKGGTDSQRLMTGTLAAAFSTSLQGDVPPVKHWFTDATLNPQAYLEITVPRLKPLKPLMQKLLTRHRPLWRRCTVRPKTLTKRPCPSFGVFGSPLGCSLFWWSFFSCG